VLVAAPWLAGGAAADPYSLRFFGNGAGDLDRVKIPVDDPDTAVPGPPVDVGADDFTIELWLRGSAAENPAAAVSCGANVDWISGNIVLDRDRYDQDRKFGLSIAGGAVVFGVSGDGTGDLTICGVSDVLDDAWHHVAVQRRRADGYLWLFVDGVLEAEADGPDGDVSYPDDGVPGNHCGGPCTDSDPFLVIGAEKHDAGPAYPSFSGWVDELRVSDTLRYAGTFTRPQQPFVPDPFTVALYHLDEGTGDAVGDASGATGGPSDGTVNYGGSPPGPEWSSEIAPIGGSPSITLTSLADGLARVTSIVPAGDGSGRLFVTLQQGQIVVWDGSQIFATPFLDLSGIVSCCGERGLLGLAFHPDYAGNGLFYVSYTDGSGDSVVARYEVSAGDGDVADDTTGTTLFTVPQPYSNHNGGQLAFGPDGFLYVGLGDGGSSGDPGDRAQDLGELLGKLLRIDPEGGAPYAVPADNPFVGVAGAEDEVWASGLRNPWRFSFDRATGDLFVADVGQGSWEEINLQRAGSPGGENYGWRLMEGSHCYDPPSGCDPGGLVYPILEYGHGDGNCSVTGGFRYRGALAPRLDGMYVYTDYCSGRFWAGQEGPGGDWFPDEVHDAAFAIGTLGEDEAGELYVASYSSSLPAYGTLYRIGVATGGTCTASPAPSLSVPASPAGGAVYQVGWSATSPAGFYEVQEATDAGFTDPYGAVVQGLSHPFAHCEDEGPTFHYRVRPLDNCDGSLVAGAWSAAGTATVSGGCTGCNVELTAATVDEPMSVSSCGTLHVAPGVDVVKPAVLTLHAAGAVVIRNGFSLASGAALRAGAPAP